MRPLRPVGPVRPVRGVRATAPVRHHAVPGAAAAARLGAAAARLGAAAAFPPARPAVLDGPYAPPPGEPRVLHADAALVVVDKPAGLLCAPGRGDDKQDCLVARLQRRFPGVLLVHRLDLATSGLMVFACTAEAHARLSAAFRERQVEKAYEARVHGPLPGDAGEIDLPLAADWPNRPLQKVCEDTGKPALTRWRRATGAPAGTVLGPGEERVWLMPVTGRTHQLRLHLAAIGCPIVGDALYGRPDDGAPRLMLHATRLAFAHPETGAALAFDLPAPF